MSLIGDEEGCVDGLHAGGAGEAPHQPVVDAVGVICVHARKVSDRVADREFDHADHTFSVLFASVVGSCRQVLYQAHSLGDFHLLFFCELTSWATDIWRRVVDWRIIILRVWLLLVIDGVSGRGRLPEERHVVRRRRFEAVAHVPLVCGAAPNGALWLAAAAVALLSDPEEGQQWSQEG